MFAEIWLTGRNEDDDAGKSKNKNSENDEGE